MKHIETTGLTAREPDFGLLCEREAYRPERVCRTCGGPLHGAERYCAMVCWRFRK